MRRVSGLRLGERSSAFRNTRRTNHLAKLKARGGAAPEGGTVAVMRTRSRVAPLVLLTAPWLFCH